MSSADCATRASRPTSSSTCGWRCTGICSACRRASTRTCGWATSCRASTTTSAKSSAWLPRRRSAWVGNGLFLVGTTVMLAWLDLRLFLLTAATAPLALVALVVYRKRLEKEIAVMRDRSADIGSFLIETLQAMKLVVTSERRAARSGALRREEPSVHPRADVDAMAVIHVGRAAGPRAVRPSRARCSCMAACASSTER